MSKRSFLSEATYIVLNLGLAGATLALVLAFESPLPAFIFILLSKWRVFAVRPRFWFANLQTNLVDTLVGLSAVVLMWASGVLMFQIAIAVLYAAWLLLLKPRSKRHTMLLQAGIAQFVSLTALFTVAYAWPSWLVVLLTWLITYSSARHALTAYDEDDITLLSLVWGFVGAELGWLAYHWTIAYAPFESVSSFKIPQIAILLLSFSYLAERVYASFRRNDGKIVFADFKWQLVFIAALVIMILIFFNGLDITEL
ncbi:MAG TPA: hypothetical protein VD907_04900 [Verrucomicrobiae bacterium]|nr:hypothetical protein [Verrucomicrobiae bacterium]